MMCMLLKLMIHDLIKMMKQEFSGRDLKLIEMMVKAKNFNFLFDLGIDQSEHQELLQKIKKHVINQFLSNETIQNSIAYQQFNQTPKNYEFFLNYVQPFFQHEGYLKGSKLLLAKKNVIIKQIMAYFISFNKIKDSYARIELNKTKAQYIKQVSVKMEGQISRSIPKTLTTEDNPINLVEKVSIKQYIQRKKDKLNKEDVVQEMNRLAKLKLKKKIINQSLGDSEKQIKNNVQQIVNEQNGQFTVQQLKKIEKKALQLNTKKKNKKKGINNKKIKKINQIMLEIQKQCNVQFNQEFFKQFLLLKNPNVKELVGQINQIVETLISMKQQKQKQGVQIEKKLVQQEINKIISTTKLNQANSLKNTRNKNKRLQQLDMQNADESIQLITKKDIIKKKAIKKNQIIQIQQTEIHKKQKEQKPSRKSNRIQNYKKDN